MEEKNVVFEVTKVGFAVNTKWSVFVDNEYIGKIDFKNNLTKKLPKGRHSVQYKVGLQKTQILNINVADEDIIVECVWDGTVRIFHVVGGNDTNVIQDKPVINKTIEPQNNIVTEQPKLNNKAKKPKTALIIIFVIIIGIVGGISLSNVFDGTYNTNTQKETLDQYAGSWVHYSPTSTGAAFSMIIDGKGNYTETKQTTISNKKIVTNGTYKIEGNIITFYYSDGKINSTYKIINNTLLKHTDYPTEYRKVK